MIFTPRPYQSVVRTFALNHERANLWVPMGGGKSGTALDVFETRRLMGEARRLLVIGPKRVAKNTWPREVEKWAGSFGHLKVATMIGTEAQRIAAARSGADVTTINFDNLPWLVQKAGSQWPWDMVICDEATRLKGLRISMQVSKKGNEFINGQGSLRARWLSKVAHKYVRFWLNLTGSPAPNGVIDLWGQQWFIDKGFALGNSFDAFSRRWFRTWKNDEGRDQIEPLPSAQREIEALMRRQTISIDLRDYFDIRRPIETVVKVQLPPAARKQYEQMRKELWTQIVVNGIDEDVEAFNAGSLSNKCLQIASGNVYYDRDGSWGAVHDEKIKALESIVEETNGEPLLVRYCFKPELAAIMKAFPHAKFFDDSRETEEAWNRGEYRMMVTHAASAGHGSNLQDGGRTLVDFSQGWDMEQDEQIIERVGPTRQFQSGHDRAVYRYRIVAEDTIEETAVLPRLKHKMSVQDALKLAMKMA
jgi:SNF2 family DNA or RNA helicase